MALFARLFPWCSSCHSSCKGGPEEVQFIKEDYVDGLERMDTPRFFDPVLAALGHQQRPSGEAIEVCIGQEPTLLQEVMITFIRTLLRGVCIEVLLNDGTVLFLETSLNYELTHLILDANEVQRSIALQDVESVATPREIKRRNILTSIQPFLDERCCTLIIRNLDFVTFRFDTERLREYFSVCIGVLIAAGQWTTTPGISGSPRAAGPAPGPGTNVTGLSSSANLCNREPSVDAITGEPEVFARHKLGNEMPQSSTSSRETENEALAKVARRVAAEARDGQMARLTSGPWPAPQPTPPWAGAGNTDPTSIHDVEAAAGDVPPMSPCGEGERRLVAESSEKRPNEEKAVPTEEPEISVKV
eukprot:gnl/TRDRNA2_/TRDRNA2_191304_c0_seq1.p1 gnl/TRDRNA2_/TRDRNA2_191304_c0~~gnl/TRDRNA2_/TRDRNA2_191304_c0_seq1.p1  ORF type:complete len:360 (-),score=58.40 gnl/TRDRNA2_/TRDRNA2_191304_c0_seq1:60-1139(-)